MNFHKNAVALCCATLAFSAMADDGALTVGTGFNYSSGTYGAATTTQMTSIPLLLKYERNDWTWKMTLPYLIVTGQAGVIPGTGGRGRGNGGGGGGGTTTTTNEGLGDLVVSGTYAAYYDSAAKFGLDLTGKVKFGTADQNKSLGTGANDYSAQVDLFKVAGAYTLFGGVGYTTFGSTSGLTLNNVFNVNVGGSLKVDDRVSTGVSYDFRERTSATAEPMSELSVFASRKLDRKWKAQAYLLKGLTSGSPDWGGGVTVNYAY